MVVSADKPIPGERCGGTSKPGEKRSPSVTSTGSRCVDIEIREAANRLAADVSDRRNKLTRKLPLQNEIPRLYITAIDAVAGRKTHIRDCRKRQLAGSGIRRIQLRYALLNRPEGLEGNRRLEKIPGSEGERIAQRPGQRHRVVSDPVSGSDDSRVVEPVGDAGARREQF